MHETEMYRETTLIIFHRQREGRCDQYHYYSLPVLVLLLKEGVGGLFGQNFLSLSQSASTQCQLRVVGVH